MNDAIRIGLVSISDRASSGVYEDKGLPALEAWFAATLANPVQFVTRLIPDEQALIEATLIELADMEQCALILTTGGTGPARARCHARSHAGRRAQGACPALAKRCARCR